MNQKSTPAKHLENIRCSPMYCFASISPSSISSAGRTLCYKLSCPRNIKFISPLFAFLLVFLFGIKIQAQPQICQDSVAMTSICEDACVICDIDGFEGRHESSTPGIAPDDFCTVLQHNIQWIAFIAGSVDLEVELAVSNCVVGPGLEVGIYEGIDCQNFQQVSECWGAQVSIAEGTSKVFTNTVPLVVGQYYYLIMDGAFGDNCDWKLTVNSGSTLVNPLDSSGVILIDEVVCPNEPIPFGVDFPTGATEFDWTVNGILVNDNSDSIEFSFPTVGNFTICVTSRNVCNEAPPTCTEILVEAIPATDIVDVFCEGDSYEIADTVLFDEGFYQFLLENVDGCDSLLTLDLTEVAISVLDLDLNICEGDTLFVGNIPYTQTGIHQETLTSIFGCDSIINLDLFSVVCNISSTITISPPSCFGENNGSIQFSVMDGTPPFTYSWVELNNTLTGSGNIALIGENITINNLPKGTYHITIQDDFGNMDIIIAEVNEPSVLSADFSPSVFNGVNISCKNGNDGILQVISIGGTPSYSYTWQSNQTTQEINNLIAGIYSVTITDQNGCTAQGDFEMVAPSPLDFVAAFNNPICDGLTTGSISVIQSSGGVSPYTYAINNNTFTEGGFFENLVEGTYELQMMDANGCVISTTEFLDAPQIPELDLGDTASVILGDTYTFLPTINNVDLIEIIWTPSDKFDCQECLNPSFIPFHDGTYNLTVTSVDSCTETSSLTLIVNKFRKFFAPSGFTPNSDGFNDYFTLYGSSEVEIISQLTIFNRWGAVVFDGKNLTPGIDTEGWNGRLKGKVVNPDVYIWKADLLFIDGEVITFSGDVTVAK